MATRYHADDSTADLQDVLQDINRRWTVVMERYKPHPLTFDIHRNKHLFPSSVARHQPEVNLLSQQWAEFHSHYQSFHQWLRNIDTEMANLNPFVSNMATVQMQLMKLKVFKFTGEKKFMDQFSSSFPLSLLAGDTGGACSSRRRPRRGQTPQLQIAGGGREQLPCQPSCHPLAAGECVKEMGPSAEVGS